MRICLCSANYVADASGYRVQPFDWGRCEQTTLEAFSGGAWEGHFRALLQRVRALGYTAIEVWQAHLRAATATERQLVTARRLLDEVGLRCASYTSFLSDPQTPRADVAAAFRVAAALGAGVIAGGMHRTMAETVDALARETGVRMAIENHGETPAAVAELLGDLPASYAATIGATVDTGIYAGQGVDPVDACQLLAGRIFHVHLKDVAAVGGHACCAAGRGVARLRAVTAELRRQAYGGYLSIECETLDHDSDPEAAESLRTVQGWLVEAPMP